MTNNKTNLWAELEGVLQDMKYAGERGSVNYNTVARVQSDMYSQQHILEAFSILNNQEQRLLLTRMTLITQGKTLKDLVPTD